MCNNKYSIKNNTILKINKTTIKYKAVTYTAITRIFPGTLKAINYLEQSKLSES